MPNDENPFLSYVGGFQVDFNYLSHASGQPKFRNYIRRIQKVLKDIDKPKGLYFYMLNIKNHWNSPVSGLSVSYREWYINLVKSFIQSNHQDDQSIEMYKEAIDAIEREKIIDESPTSRLYLARTYENDSNNFESFMEYSSCYLGAMLAMGANAMQHHLTAVKNNDSAQLNRISRHWTLAEKLTESCHLASNQTRTGLVPYEFSFTRNQTVKIGFDGYSLRQVTLLISTPTNCKPLTLTVPNLRRVISFYGD